MKNILVVTHERSGTHLTINIINHKNKGDYIPIGKLPKYETHNLETYIKYVNFGVKYELYNPNIIFKSHHQVQFFEHDIDQLFDKFKIVYVKRDILDMLISYYNFLNGNGFDENNKSIPIKNFPKFKDWIFMKPCEVGYKYFEKYPDPHIYIEPDDYIDRYLMHHQDWSKYKDEILTINYEDILNKFDETKEKLENYLNIKVGIIPNLNDKSFPNYAPNKGIIGSHIEFMDYELINKIKNRIVPKTKYYEIKKLNFSI